MTDFYTTQSFSNSLILIIFSRFLNCRSTNGGGISISTILSTSKIEKCLFFDCIVTGNGGGIWSVSNNFTSFGNCFSNCCANYGSSISTGSLNHINNFTSTTLTTNTYSNTFFMGSDNIISTNVNSSKSICTWNSGIGILNSLKTNILFYTSFNNNGNSGFHFISSSNNQKSIYNNLINNSVNIGVITYDNSNLIINNSFFINNIGPIAGGINSGSINLFNCDSNKPFITSGNILSTLNSKFNLNTYSLPIIYHLITWKCEGIEFKNTFKDHKKNLIIFKFFNLFINYIISST